MEENTSHQIEYENEDMDFLRENDRLVDARFLLEEWQKKENIYHIDSLLTH